jgi:multiple sugar transport system permease protein
MNKRRSLLSWLAGWKYWLLMGVLALPFIFPILWLVLSAFKPAAQIYSDTLKWLPAPMTIENFQKAWDLLHLPRLFTNTIFITAASVTGSALSSSMVGFAFGTLPARGKDFLFFLLMVTIMIPASVTLIPTFILFSKLGWVDTYLPLIIPQFCANAFYVFLFRQFFSSVPVELFESAELDGCNPLGTYWYIAIPVSRPILTVVAVFAAIASWHDFLNPLVYLNSANHYTLSLGLAAFQRFYYTQIHYLLPAALLTLLPLMVFFYFTQDAFIRGIISTQLLS